MYVCWLFLNSCFLFLGNSWQTTAKRSINLAFPFVPLKTVGGESESHLNCDHHVVLPLPTLCLASEAKSPKSKSKIENKIFPCLCQKDTRGNLRLPIVFFSPSLWRLINCYAVFVGGFEFWALQVVLLRG